MLWILFVMGMVAAVVIAIIVGGLATPRDHVVARTIALPASVDAVWATIRDFGRYGDWRHELESAEVIDAEQSQPRWRENSTRGSVAFGVTIEEPPHRLAARILDEDLPFAGEWTWDVIEQDAGARITITERGSVGNPIFRFFGAHFIGHTRSIDAYLNALAEHYGTRAVFIDDATPS